MSADSAITYTSVHSEARSWSIPSEDPYEEAARQLLEQAPRSPEYIPDPMELEDHVPVYIPEPEHPEDLVPAEDEAPTPLLPPSFLSPRIRPLSPRALAAEMRDVASSLHHSLHPSGTPKFRDTERDDDRLRDGQHEGQLSEDRAAVRAEIEVLKLTAGPLEARVTVLECEVASPRVGSVPVLHDDLAVQLIHVYPGPGRAGSTLKLWRDLVAGSLDFGYDCSYYAVC
ncbi:hypothetical protein Tco_0580580 [Tanacetum coccineum]